jgi:hypothetical protein
MGFRNTSPNPVGFLFPARPPSRSHQALVISHAKQALMNFSRFLAECGGVR